MQHACPINFQKYDNTLARIASVYTMIILGVYFVSGNVLVFLFLFLDLFLRTYVDTKYSILYFVASMTKERLRLESMMKDGAAKKLASNFGLLFLALSTAAHFLGYDEMLYIVIGIYLFCLFLDAFFDFCLGCKIYYIYKLLR